jgi:predicted GTPase
MQSVDTLTILVLGKGGVGKSSTVNSIVGERVAIVSAFQV